MLKNTHVKKENIIILLVLSKFAFKTSKSPSVTLIFSKNIMHENLNQKLKSKNK